MRAWLPILLSGGRGFLYVPEGMTLPGLAMLSPSIVLLAVGTGALPRQLPQDLDFSLNGLHMLMAEEGRFVKGGRHVVHGGQMSHIGYGHRLYGEEGLGFERGIEERDAEAFLRKDVERAAGSARSLVHIPLHQHEFDALVMLAFNIGVDGFRDSLVLQHLNSGKRREAGEAFCAHSRIRARNPDGSPKGAAQESPAIRRRREEERYLFLTGRYVQAPPRNEADRHHRMK